MKYALVIDERRVERIGQRKTAELIATCRMNCRRSADDVAAIDQKNENIIDAIPMHTFGRRLSFLFFASFYPKLMNFGSPRANVGRERAECNGAEFQNPPQNASIAGGCRYRLEPALDISLQRVVGATLIVRLMWPAHDVSVARHRKHRMPASPETPMFGQIGIRRQVVPARRKIRPLLAMENAAERTIHDIGVGECETAVRQ